MSSRAGLRLQLMREQAMQDSNNSMETTSSSNPRQSVGNNNTPSAATSNTIPIRAINLNGAPHERGSSGSSSASGSQSALKSSPIIISQPIRFTGSRLVHLPPQIIHVQRQGGVSSTHDGNVVMGGSMPPALHGDTPPPRVTIIKHDRLVNNTPPAAVGQQPSRNSPAEFSPTGVDSSPQSASFTSAQSEFQIDDIIIDEILNLEEDQLRRKQQNAPQLATSYSFAETLPGGNVSATINSGRQTATIESPLSPNSDYYRSPYPEPVSSSAPTSTIDLDGEIQQQKHRHFDLDQDYVRDRRKKDIHNMIERRRRYNINDRIKELGMMLPKHTSEDMKLNKGTILKASCDYIRSLQRERDNYNRLHTRQQLIELQNRNYQTRIKELEHQLRDAGVAVKPQQFQEVPVAVGLPSRQIKQEPIDTPTRDQPALSQSQMSDGDRYGTDCLTELSDSAAAMALSSAQQQPPPYSAQTSSSSGYYPQGDILETPPAHAFSNQRPSFVQQQVASNTSSGVANPYMSELYMDLNADCQSPLMGGSDPMIGAVIGGGGPPSSDSGGVGAQQHSGGSVVTTQMQLGGVGQLSPDVQWDTQGFSPDNRNAPLNAQQQIGPMHDATTPGRMDLS